MASVARQRGSPFPSVSTIPSFQDRPNSPRAKEGDKRKAKPKMSTSPHVNDVFDAFVAAKQAIDKVPDLEAQIKALQDQLSTANQMVDLYAQDQINFKNELDTHKNKLSAAEASLETHRKSNSDLQARFDLVLGTLRDITSGIGTTLGVVEPPKPVEPLGLSTEDESKSDVHGAGPSVESEPAPQVDPTASMVATTATVNTPTVTEPIAVSGQSGEVSVPLDPTPSVIQSSDANGTGVTVSNTGNTSNLKPLNDTEHERRAKGLDWYDIYHTKHDRMISTPAPEVPVTPAVPFAQSMESQSQNAQSPVETASSTTPVAPQSIDASSPEQMPDWLYRNLR